MSHQRIEQVFPAEVAQHGADQVWIAWHWVCAHQITSETTMGQAKRLTRERLQHPTEKGKDTPTA